MPNTSKRKRGNRVTRDQKIAAKRQSVRSELKRIHTQVGEDDIDRHLQLLAQAKQYEQEAEQLQRQAEQAEKRQVQAEDEAEEAMITALQRKLTAAKALDADWKAVQLQEMIRKRMELATIWYPRGEMTAELELCKNLLAVCPVTYGRAKLVFEQEVSRLYMPPVVHFGYAHGGEGGGFVGAEVRESYDLQDQCGIQVERVLVKMVPYLLNEEPRSMLSVERDDDGWCGHSHFKLQPVVSVWVRALRGLPISMDLIPYILSWLVGDGPSYVQRRLRRLIVGTCKALSSVAKTKSKNKKNHAGTVAKKRPRRKV